MTSIQEEELGNKQTNDLVTNKDSNEITNEIAQLAKSAKTYEKG